MAAAIVFSVLAARSRRTAQALVEIDIETQVPRSDVCVEGFVLHCTAQ